MPYMRLISQARKIWENVIIVNSNISFFYLQIFYFYSLTHRQSIFVAKGKKIDGVHRPGEGGVLDISLSREVRRGSSYPDPF